ncbi:YhjD/YihY/BrkB family envelope integrity protein [Mycoplasma sp. 744]|uniref:YihY/virulence factor BrkB family protein n=1 Tax=Mycoplasma sp. 744 TaxID=3108531 RepID=UPI002B1D199A|nr:YhjD/YihY/BrkB family envelope integrity protein [Mycoplasma sp. 744]MEA4115225.1 YhjD/YihY/BrkB family envelope integrity protein [Mycoplasma sp. 744]
MFNKSKNNKDKKFKKDYKNNLKQKSFYKNISLNKENNFSILGKIIRFFLIIILKITTPKNSWKNKNKTKELIDRAYKKYVSEDLVFIPLSLAFYFLISFVPIITILIVLLSLIPNYDSYFINIILSRIIPGINDVINLSNSFKNTTLQTISIILLLLTSLWIASGGFAKWVYSQNYIYKHEQLGNLITNRFKGFIIVIGISLYLFISICLYIWFFKLFNLKENTTQFDTVFYCSFTIYLFLILYCGITLLYKLTPNFKNPLNMIFPGALTASIPIAIFIIIFGYLSSWINYSKYGIISTFMYIGLFVSFLSYCLLLGTIVNEAYYKTYHSSFTIKKNYWFTWNKKY